MTKKPKPKKKANRFSFLKRRLVGGDVDKMQKAFALTLEALKPLNKRERERVLMALDDLLT